MSGLAALAVALAPATASASSFGSVIDLGQNVVPAGAPAVVNGQDEVPVQNGIWVDGSVTVPAAPASDPTATFTPQALSSTGVAVGFATTTMGSTLPAYWDSAHAAGFVEVSLSGLTVNGSAATSGRLTSVDATGEAVGEVQNAAGSAAADFAGLFVPGAGGLPAGNPQVVTNLGGSVHSLGGISADWEDGADTSGTLFAFNRQTAVRTGSNLVGVEGGPGGFADNGLLAGVSSSTSAPEVLTPAGVYTPLQVPSGDGAGLYGINASGVVVGQIRTNSTSVGATWSASSGASSPLLGEVTANAPGFSSLAPTGINDADDIDGTGTINGQTHGFLVRVAPIVPPVVTSTGDAAASDPSSGSCDTGQTVADATGGQVPECTLRAAIQAVNATGTSAQQITFDIPGGGSPSIALGSPLPALTAPGVVVDGTSESGGSVTVDGTKIGGTGSCITVQAAGIVVRGLDLTNCPTGLELGAPGQDKVQGVVIGLAANGSTPTPGAAGVVVDEGSSGNLIGGTDPTQRDVISAEGYGIELGGSDTTVQGDLLGTDVTGRAFVPDQVGVLIVSSSSADTIGGSTTVTGAAPGNVIDAGNPTSQADYPVLDDGPSTTIAGNLIGTDMTGTVAYAPVTGYAALAGVLVAGAGRGDVVGGASGSGNVIVGSSLAQVMLDGGTVANPQVVGNRLGVTATGAVRASPDAAGVFDAGAASATIGGKGEGNVITGQQDGVLIRKEAQEIDFTETVVVDGQSETQTIQLPGTDTAATATHAAVKDNVIGPLPGGRMVPTTAQQVGVLDAGGRQDSIGPGNVISFNAVGIKLDGTNASTTEGNLIGTGAGGLDALPNGVGIEVIGSAVKTSVGASGMPDTVSGNLLGLDLDAGVAVVHGERVGMSMHGNALLKPFGGTLPVNIRDAAAHTGHGGILVDTHAIATAIGGTARGDEVTVGGTDGTGITVRSPAILIRDRIGVADGSSAALPNRGDGLLIDTSGREPVLFAGGIVAHSGGVGVLVSGRRDAMIPFTEIYDNTKGGLEIRSVDVPKAPKLFEAVNRNVDGVPRTVLTVEPEVPRGEFGQLDVYATPSCERHGGGKRQILSARLRGGSDRQLKLGARINPVGSTITALLTVTPGNNLAQQIDQRDTPDGRTSAFSRCVEIKPSR